MSFEIEINKYGNIPLIKEMARRSKSLQPVLLDIANMIKENSRLSFEKGQSPYGDKWHELSAATQARKGRGGVDAKPLRDKGVLMNSIAVGQVVNNSITVGTNLIYAAIHNFGGKAGRNLSVTIPQRQYLPTNGLTYEQEEEVTSMLEDYLQYG